MSGCESCASRDKCSSKDKENCQTNSINIKVMPKYGKVKNIIGIISGKGGVGKSTITGITAIELAKKGYKVGVLDADITGPSMPRILGISDKRAEMTAIDENTFMIEPVETKLGIKVISMNLLNPVEDQPVIWRGPVLTGVLNQFYTDTNWGELDYLLIDMPPGTGDTALTVMQSFPLKEIIVVSTPQAMVSMIVKKVVIMAEKVGVKVKGLVENMAYIQCDECGKKMKVFSKKSSEECAEYVGLPLICELPINIELTEALEEGRMEDYVVDSPLYDQLFGALY